MITFDPYPSFLDPWLKSHTWEIPHTSHVAKLALQLFDQLYPLFSLAPQDRTVLEAAAWLHDIAYANSPQHHETTAAQLVADQRLAGFTEEDMNAVVFAIKHHGKAGPSPASDDSEKGAKLAALLQIADGLDHSHIQDTTILNIEIQPDNVEIHIACGWYPQTAVWTAEKATCWDCCIDHALTLIPKMIKRHHLFDGIIDPDDTLEYAMRKILLSQYRIMADTIDGILNDSGAEYLHDFRVALRRFRAALKIFSTAAQEVPPAEHKKDLDRISDQLGPARDLQSWNTFLSDQEFLEQIKNDPAWPDYLTRHNQALNESNQLLHQTVASPEFQKVLKRLAYSLRIEWETAFRKQHLKKEQYGSFIARKLLQQYQQILKKHELKESNNPEDLHKLRKRCRKGRYIAEFAAPAIGEHGQLLAELLKKLADDLGDIHDMDVHLERHDTIQLPNSLQEFMHQHRNEAFKRLHRHWRRISDNDFVKKTNKELTKYGREDT